MQGASWSRTKHAFVTHDPSPPALEAVVRPQDVAPFAGIVCCYHTSSVRLLAAGQAFLGEPRVRLPTPGSSDFRCSIARAGQHSAPALETGLRPPVACCLRRLAARLSSTHLPGAASLSVGPAAQIVSQPSRLHHDPGQAPECMAAGLPVYPDGGHAQAVRLSCMQTWQRAQAPSSRGDPNVEHLHAELQHCLCRH